MASLCTIQFSCFYRVLLQTCSQQVNIFMHEVWFLFCMLHLFLARLIWQLGYNKILSLHNYEQERPENFCTCVELPLLYQSLQIALNNEHVWRMRIVKGNWLQFLKDVYGILTHPLKCINCVLRFTTAFSWEQVKVQCLFVQEFSTPADTVDNTDRWQTTPKRNIAVVVSRQLSLFRNLS